MRALIVEDHDVYREMLQATLSNRGYETTAVCNAHELLSVATAAGPPDVAIFDWMLGNQKTGSEAACELKARYPAVRTILITGYPVDFSVQSTAAKGIDALLQKPFSSAELLETLENLLSGKPGPGSQC